jgi:hypothetical protein
MKMILDQWIDEPEGKALMGVSRKIRIINLILIVL